VFQIQTVRNFVYKQQAKDGHVFRGDRGGAGVTPGSLASLGMTGSGGWSYDPVPRGRSSTCPKKGRNSKEKAGLNTAVGEWFVHSSEWVAAVKTKLNSKWDVMGTLRGRNR